RHTRFSRDWSSDVCSSDLCQHVIIKQFANASLMEALSMIRCGFELETQRFNGMRTDQEPDHKDVMDLAKQMAEENWEKHREEYRSEERRVGKEGRSRVWRE